MKLTVMNEPIVKPGRILIVDDESIVHKSIRNILSKGSYTIDSAFTGSQALEAVESVKYDLVICDIKLADMDGIELLKQVKFIDNLLEVIIITGYGSIKTRNQALQHKAYKYIMKPFSDIAKFFAITEEAIKRVQIVRHNNRLFQSFTAGKISNIFADFDMLPDFCEENSAIFKCLLQVVDDAIVILDKNGTIVFSNVVFMKMIGEPYLQLICNNIEKYIHSDVEDVLYNIAGRSRFDTKLVLKTKYENKINVSLTSVPVFNKKEYSGTLLKIFDLTELDGVRHKLELLANLVESAKFDMMLVIKKPNGNITECNALTVSTLLYTKSKILSMKVENLFKLEPGYKWTEIYDVADRFSQWSGEMTAQCKDGTTLPVNVSISKSEDVQDTLLCFVRDISKEKEVDRVKSEFISIASHELRTPLTSIKNAVDIIIKGKAGDINDTQLKFLSMAERNVNRLIELINDLLNISKIEEGKLELSCSVTSIKTAVENAIDTFYTLVDEKHIKLIVNMEDNLPEIFGDQSKVEQILVNLITNALKFTNKGEIIIELKKTLGENDENDYADGCISISVKDTGIGIPVEEISSIFDKFKQVESTLSKNKLPGSGLGLAICKGLVEAHGGSIWCNSEVGVGSEFTFTLPAINNKKEYYIVLGKEISKIKEVQSYISVLVFKIENYAELTGDKGIEKGIETLSALKAMILSGGIKKNDKINLIVPEGKMIIIMPSTDRSELELAKRRLWQSVGEKNVTGDDGILPVISVGTSVFPEDGKSPGELLYNAMSYMEDDEGKIYNN